MFEVMFIHIFERNTFLSFFDKDKSEKLVFGDFI